MININIKFIADELTPGLENGDYSVNSGATVRDLLDACQKKCGVVLPEQNYKLMYPLFNGKRISIDSELDKPGTIHLCRVVMGG